jgi:hypothetical protein
MEAKHAVAAGTMNEELLSAWRVHQIGGVRFIVDLPAFINKCSDYYSCLHWYQGSKNFSNRTVFTKTRVVGLIILVGGISVYTTVSNT